MVIIKTKELANAWLIHFCKQDGEIFKTKRIDEESYPEELVNYFAKQFYPAFGIKVKVQNE